MTYQKPDRAKRLSEEYVAKCLDDLLTIENTGTTEGVSEECRKLYDEAVLIMWNIAPRGLVSYASTAHILYITSNRDLARWAWLITRVGRREDVAFVRNVSVFVLSDLIVSVGDNEGLSTRFYLPGRLLTNPAHGQRWILREVVNGNIREEEFVVPVMSPKLIPMFYKPKTNEAIVIRLPIDGGFEFVVIPREVVKNG
jgi:hypothetical protein